MFIDEAAIFVRAGKGGDGCMSFRREKFVPKGGPDGGDGGRGGDVVLVVDRNMTTLLDFRYRKRYAAGSGGHGMGKKKTGENGRDCLIPVPPGTVALDAESKIQLGDLTREGQRLIIAGGGKGGRGNVHFATPAHRAPRKATQGKAGEERTVLLHLKLLADVGLVGKPNAGKSTLLSRISKARPKIADYPFTTKSPNLGMVRGKGRDFVVADIPGLIEGAHTGKGMGIRFLKHIERTRLLLVLVEVTGEDVVGEYRGLLEELGAFSRKLIEKPRYLILTKADLVAPDYQADCPLHTEQVIVRVVSAVTGTGIDELMETVEKKLLELSLGEDEDGRG